MKIISTDFDRWIGFTNDPAETRRWCGWLFLGRAEIYVYPWRVHFRWQK